MTIRELVEGMTDWMPGFPKSRSTPPGSAMRLLGWRLLLHAMFPAFTHLNAKILDADAGEKALRE